MDDYSKLENLSLATGIGISLLDITGQVLFESSVGAPAFLKLLYDKLDIEENCRVSFLYGCYQARRFGGRYVFFAPSGLMYCVAPLLGDKGEMLSGILAGPYLMTDYDDYIEYDVLRRAAFSPNEIDALYKHVNQVPRISPMQAHGLCEHIYYIASTYNSGFAMAGQTLALTDVMYAAYPIEKESELLAALTKGDIFTANTVLGEILKQVLTYGSGNIEVLRSRVMELTVLLSRAALKGGADVNAILGLNYDYLREIDSFTSIEDIVLWLHTVARQFSKHVFDFSGSKHVDIIYKAVEYIKRNYAGKLSLQEIAKHLYISQQYFCRIFKEETGQTPGGYITFVRIEESKKLLRDPAINIADIPELVGFESQSYFTKKFKKETGITPGRYRRGDRL